MTARLGAGYARDYRTRLIADIRPHWVGICGIKPGDCVTPHSNHFPDGTQLSRLAFTRVTAADGVISHRPGFPPLRQET